MGLSALWWWIDRWRKSTAYMDMTLAEQGAYRNLLDEAQLRGGPLPADERVLAKACGDALAWKDVRTAVMAHFERGPDGWRNPTLDSVIRESERRATNQRNYRDRNNGRGNAADNGGGNEHGNVTVNKTNNRAASPSPSPSPSLISGSVSVSQRKDIVPSALTPTVSEDARFARFWSAYPRKTGKAAALKSWTRLHPTEARLDQMLATIARQRSEPQWTKDQGQFIPLPATWLNQGRWDDEPTAAATEPARPPGTYVMGFRLEDLEKTPEERAAAAEWEKARARYR